MHCHSRLLAKLGVILNCLLCFGIMLDKWLDWYCFQSVRLCFNVLSNARPGHLYTTKIDASSLLRKTVKTVNMFKKSLGKWIHTILDMPKIDNYGGWRNISFFDYDHDQWSQSLLNSRWYLRSAIVSLWPSMILLLPSFRCFSSD